jgi:hypothetical protein
VGDPAEALDQTAFSGWAHGIRARPQVMKLTGIAWQVVQLEFRTTQGARPVDREPHEEMARGADRLVPEDLVQLDRQRPVPRPTWRASLEQRPQ